jgi:glycosyltransferase involved in cell wall biosynthesis
LRVLQVVCGAGFAGVERHVVNLANALTADGHELLVVGGAPVRMRAELARAVEWRAGTSLPAALAAGLRSGRVDVVNTHMTAADLVGLLAAAPRGLPVVSTRHFAGPRGSRPAGRVVAALADRRLAGQIAVSAYAAERIGGAAVVVHPGVPVVPDVDPAARRTTVLVAQRLEAEKDTDVALRAWAASSGPRRGWRLEVAGAGALADSLRSLAADLGVADSVDFLGHVADLPARLRSASVLLAPTPIEGFGLTVVEAMAHGVPVVAAAAGGHLETIGAVPDPMLFAAGDPLVAARRLDDLIGAPTLRAEYGAAARDHQRTHLTFGALAARTLAVYRGVLR